MTAGPQRYRAIAAALASTVVIGACSGARVNWQYPRASSSAFAEPDTTSSGALFKSAASEHPGEAGFLLVPHGRDAFMSRLAMADLAEKTLDAQYYIWAPDTTGRILAEHLTRAADRGVRVRLLIDDMYQTAERDINVAVLDAHPKIEIRVFNPATRRGARGLSFVGDFQRLNRRMHNKIYVMDNALAVVGGRNIGDVYFGVQPDVNYSDLDVMAAGPIVAEISARFDAFWNSEWAIPVGAVVKELPNEQDSAIVRKEFETHVASAGYPYPLDETPDQLRARLARFRDDFVWATGGVLGDDPSKVVASSDTGVVREAISQRITGVTKELFVSSAYLVLTERAIDRLRALRARGVVVRILTNSAATNDVMPAHAGSCRLRRYAQEAHRCRGGALRASTGQQLRTQVVGARRSV